MHSFNNTKSYHFRNWITRNSCTLSTIIPLHKYYVPVYLGCRCEAGCGLMQVKIQLRQCLFISVPLTEARRRKIALDSNDDCRRASSRGLIPKAKVKTIKMTFVIVFGEYRMSQVETL